MKYVSLFLFVFLCISSLSIASADRPNTDSVTTLKVGITGSEPFIFSEVKKGIAIEIWEKIAKANSWKFDYVEFSNPEKAIYSLKEKNIDVVVGPISITADRIGKVDFSQPFYYSGISIVSKLQEQTFFQKIKSLFTLRLLGAISVFLLILAGVGGLLWLAERKKSPEQFSSNPLKGIGTGMWLAIVTMSTTGYGDKAPITLLGRIIAGTWMVISILFATTMVAGIATTLSLSSTEKATISNFNELSEKKTGTILGSSSQLILTKTKAQVETFVSLNQAIKKLEKGELEAVVFDRPQLLYYFKNYHNENLFLSKAEYLKQGYGFAFSTNSVIKEKTNTSLLRLSESQEIEKIIHTYIEKDE